MAIKLQTNFLKEAIRSNDLVYLQKIPHTEYSVLNTNDKAILLKLLRTNIDTFGLNIEILEIAKVCMNGDQSLEFRNAVDGFCKELGRKTNDFGKMCYLKGKIEYLRKKVRSVDEVEAKEIIDLDMINKE